MKLEAIKSETGKLVTKKSKVMRLRVRKQKTKKKRCHGRGMRWVLVL